MYFYVKRTYLILTLAVILIAISLTSVKAAVNSIEWTTFFDTGRRATSGMAVGASGNAILVGFKNIRKISGTGRLLWSREPKAVTGDAYADLGDVAVDADGHIYVTGVSFGLRNSSGDFISKYGPRGGHRWTRAFKNKEAEIRGIDIDTAGKIYVVGIAHKPLPNMTQSSEFGDAFVRKYDSGGKIDWTRQFSLDDPGGYSQSVAMDVAVGPRGGVYVLVMTGDDELFLRKFSPRGGVRWTRPVALREPYYLWSESRIAVDGAGGVTVGFTIDIDRQAPEAVTVKYSHKGKRLWARRWFDHDLHAVTVDSDRSVYIVGIDDHQRAFVRKYSSAGVRQFTRFFLAGQAWGADTDSDMNLFVSGERSGDGSSFLVKFRR